MSGLRNLVDKLKPTFSEGGKLSFLASTFDAFETFLFVPNTTTQKGAHIRDCNDMKRTMIVVVVALLPALLFGMYNTGYQVGMTGWAAFWFGFLQVLPMIVVSYVVGLGIEFAFAQARGMGAEGSELAQAVAMASNLAEEFAADPATEPEPLERDGLTASCAIATVAADDADHAGSQTDPDADGAPAGDSSGAAGTLYRATILVTDGDGDEVYRLVTERYARGAATSGHGDDATGTDGDAPVEAAADGSASTGTASAADGSAVDSPSPADGDASSSPVDNASPSDQGEVI